MKIILLFITDNGEKISKKIKKSLSKHCVETKKISFGDFKQVFSYAMTFDAVIAIMATGIVVRGIANYIKCKTKDPAVLVVDEKAKFVISLLSGHIGGANELTLKISNYIGAIPVITTASDVNNLPAIDVYAKEKGFEISDKKLYTKFATNLVNGNKIYVFIEKGLDDGFFDKECFQKFSLEEKFLSLENLKLALTYKTFTPKNILYLIPKTLSVGLGFHKGLASEELIEFICNAFNQNSISVKAIKKIATIDKRKSENSFLEVCKYFNAEPVFYTEEDLSKVKTFYQSETVKKYHKTGNISEASAYLASNMGAIIIPKIKGGNKTLCVALEKYS